MTFHDWLFSKYPANSAMDGAWGIGHILTLVVIVGAIIALTVLLKNKSDACKRKVFVVMAAVILFFELARRLIGIADGRVVDFTTAMRTLLPRPWCAISCWLLMISVVVNKKFFYNFTAMSGILCTLVFFAYPMAGFNNKYILFENVYSIVTHSLLMIGSFTLITLKMTDFQYKTAWKEGICLVAIFAYGFLEIFVLGIEKDPLYFMPKNDVMDIFGMSYGLYLPLYILFLCVYFSAFYLVPYFTKKRRAN